MNIVNNNGVNNNGDGATRSTLLNNNNQSNKLLLEKHDSKSDGKIKKPSCQLCCKPNFPMKNINGHFYHVTCLFMFDLGIVFL